MPWPSKAIISNIIGRDKSTVQRHLREMGKNGLVRRVSRYQEAGGQTSNEYDLSGLVTKLAALAEEKEKEQKKRDEEDARKRRGYEQ